MRPTLTIAIPTYNRAALLESQLAWLATSVQGHEDRCEIVLSDNNSTDATPQVIERWVDRLGPAVRMHRQDRNVGAVRNIAFCIQEAAGEFVWTVSDDDRITDDAVTAVLSRLDRHSSLEVLLLNFSSRDVTTDQVLFERCFDVDEESVSDPGLPLFEHLMRPSNPGRWGGLALTTALVYRSERARSALNSWPGALANLNMQLFVTAFCAAHGPMLVTRRNYLECASGRHHFAGDTRTHLRFAVAEYAESFLRLISTGVDPRLARRKILGLPRNTSRRLLARGLLRHPLVSLEVAGRYIAALWRSHTAVRAHERQSRSEGLLNK